MKDKKVIIGLIGIFALILLCICTVILVFSLSYTSHKEIPNVSLDNKIVYRYTDSSVAPEYNRNYTVTVSPDKLYVEVDSYGKILREENYDITLEESRKVVEKFNESEIANSLNIKDSNGCTGGTGKLITVFQNGEIVFIGENYYCGGEIYGNMTGDVEGFVMVVEDMIPFTPELVEYDGN